MKNEVMDFEELKQELRHFAKARNWEKFHNPKNLSMALMVESAELLEIFQWLSFEAAENVKQDSIQKKAIAEEIADIILYAVRLADLLEINIPTAIANKIKKNEMKYPA